MSTNSGLDFVVVTSAQKPRREQRILIRSHASRARGKKRPRPRIKSWILQRHSSPTDTTEDYHSIPKRVGSDFSFIHLPIELQPYMEKDIFQALSPMREALYPPEICMQVDPSSSSWTTSLFSDLVYLHCTVFSVEAYLDLCHGRQQSPLTQFHFSKTVKLLQDRLDSDAAESISDPTIMVVSTLGLTAEITGDRSAAAYHMEGLAGMVKMRGGLEMLRFENSRLPAKVCRVDLSLVLRFNNKPVFFNDTMSWEPFIAKRNLMNRHDPGNFVKQEIAAFIKTLDWRLGNIWKDLHEFCHLSNLAFQTSYKLSPNTFSEILVSILYRLWNLSFEESPMMEALRLGMTAFAAGVFFQWRGIRQRLTYLDEAFDGALLNLRKLENTIEPPWVIFWLLMIQRSSVTGRDFDEIFVEWMQDTLSYLQYKTRKDVREGMKAFLWIDFLHDPLMSVVEIGSRGIELVKRP